MTSYSGKLIRKTPLVPTQQAASGVWTVTDAAAAVKNNIWPVAGVPDPISRSVRLRSSASAYLNRTAGAPTSNLKYTMSVWMKRGKFGAQQSIFSSYNGASEYAIGYFDANDKLNFIGDSATAGRTFGLTTSAVYRDPSAWYHIVMVFDSANATVANRCIIYVNGVSQTLTGTTVPLNTPSYFNTNGIVGYLNQNGGSTSYNDCYLTEINFIDGQALTPASFGTTDAFTGAWVPMAYTGTYGANGFYLNFKDNTSTTTLGYDYSGNSNNWTANNISLTAGTTYDSMLDVPTPWVGYAATTDKTAVTRGNYAVLNPLDYGGTQVKSIITEANLKGFDAGSVSYNSTSVASFGVTSGKFYCEFTSITAYVQAGILYGLPTSDMTAAGIRYYGNNGIIYKDGVSQGTFATYTTNDIIGLALDADAKTIAFYKNNTLITTITYTSTNAVYLGALFPNTSAGGIYANFGQRPFTYTPPAGFQTLCATNLPDPTIKLGAQYMAASTYTGTGATQSIVNSGNNTTATTFQPDLVWTKSRANAYNNDLIDSVRGNTQILQSNNTTAETTATTAYSLVSFNSNGYTVGASENSNLSGTSVGWQWKAAGSTVSNTSGTITSTVSANTTAGFSIVTYTGTGSNATVGHGLGVAPSMIIVKSRSTTGDWKVYNVNVGNTYQGFLNDPAAFQGSSPTVWNSTTPTSTVFSIGTNAGVNGSGTTYVAYCWAPIAGYSAFGKYTGNGSTDGPFVYLGFRPRYFLIKRSDASYDWYIHDTSRDTYNAMNKELYPNTSDAEVSSSRVFDALSNGFKVRDSNAGINASGGTYIYAAFAENPFKYSNAR